MRIMPSSTSRVLTRAVIVRNMRAFSIINLYSDFYDK